MLLLDPPGTGKSYPATGLEIRACQARQRVPFAAATEWVTWLARPIKGGDCTTNCADWATIGVVGHL